MPKPNPFRVLVFALPSLAVGAVAVALLALAGVTALVKLLLETAAGLLMRASYGLVGAPYSDDLAPAKGVDWPDAAQARQQAAAGPAKAAEPPAKG